MTQALAVALWISGIGGAALLVIKLGGAIWQGFSKLVRLADVLLGDGARLSLAAWLEKTDERLERMEDRLGIVEGLDSRIAANEGRIGHLEASFQAVQAFITEWEASRDRANSAADADTTPVARDR